MNTTTETKEYTIDASGRRLGRLATEVATLVLGKNLPNYRENEVMDVRVVVENASQLDISDKKLDSKEYAQYSGYPGGRRVRSAREIVEKDGYGELVRRAVNGMLPKNKLQSRRMKNLTVTE